MRRGPRWFAGSADAIYQSLNLIYDERPDYILVFGADHIFRTDPRQMVAQHLESGAGLTVAGIRVPIEQAGQFGVIEAEADGQKIKAFHEKPTDITGLPDDPGQVLASMGNYVFDVKTMIDVVSTDAENEKSAHDIGHNIIPMMVAEGVAQVWDFAKTRVPGSVERERGYWRDIGTIDAYYDAHMDMIATEPVFNLYNAQWPILKLHERRPAGEVRPPGAGRTGHGARLDGLRRRRRLRRRGAPLGAVARRADLHSRALVEGCILMHEVDIGRDAIVRNAILDKNVRVAPGVAGSASTRGRPRALPHLRRRHRRDRQRRDRGCLTRGSRCSRASTRPRSTAAPASTSSTSRASSPGSST